MRISSSTTSNFKRTPKLCHSLHSAPEEQMKEHYTAGFPMSRAFRDVGLCIRMSSASPANLCILTRVHFFVGDCLNCRGGRATPDWRRSSKHEWRAKHAESHAAHPRARLQRDGIEYLDPVFNQKLDSRPVPGDLGVPGAKEPNGVNESPPRDHHPC